ncbi:MAG: hypothetical protein Tsb0020_44300 [Haliangiales bacterium]
MSKQTPIPDWLLERVAADDIPAKQRAEIEARLAADETSQARLEELRRANQAILAQYPPAQVTAEIERRLHLAEVAARTQSQAPRWLSWGVIGGLAAATAAAALMLTTSPGPGPGPTATHDPIDPLVAVGPEVTRAKGDARLIAYRKRGDDVERLTQAAPVRAGDLIQLSYLAAGQAHGVVLSIDGAGAVTLHYPRTPGGHTGLDDGGPIALPHAYELDDAPAFERFFFITGPAPIDVQHVLEQASDLANSGRADADQATLSLDSALTQWSLLLTKETSHE